jgi:hypothetical protein
MTISGSSSGTSVNKQPEPAKIKLDHQWQQQRHLMTSNLSYDLKHLS